MAIRQKTQTLRFCYTGLCLQHQPWSVGKSVKERLKNGKNLSHLPLEVGGAQWAKSGGEAVL